MGKRGIYKSTQLGFTIFLAALLILPSLVYSKGKKPASSSKAAKSEAISWKKNKKIRTLDAGQFSDADYITVRGLAKLAQAQLRWQPVANQACLSRTDGLMCFNWEDSKIFKNGDSISTPTALHYINHELWVPVQFVTSKSFEDFSTSNIFWNPVERTLTQETPPNLTLPPVENLGGLYRVKILFKEEMPYQIIEHSPKRVWLRFVKGRFSTSQILEGDALIDQVKIVQHRHSADLVIKMGRDAGENDIRFDPKNNFLVVDVVAKGKTMPDNKPWPALVAAGPVITIPKKKKFRPLDDASIRTIVIDAGHGGMDSGAIGTRGTYEKDINLKVALEIAKQLKRQKNLRIILTRDKDEFISLNERTNIANEAKADMFISIHCNSSISAKSSGFETYFLSPDATDAAAEAVARLENSVVQLETKKNGAGSDKLGGLLASMAVYEYLNESSEAAGMICHHVKEKSPVDKTSIKEANFHVLRGAQMPGVLVELEYLSNPVTELKLRSARFRTQVVKGITAGILSYDDKVRREKLVKTAKR